ncbi:hypothetical protein ACS0TY_032380 [Phlomoides rotata]
MKRQLETNDIASCLPRGCRNFVDQRRRLRLDDGDAEAIHQAAYEEFNDVVSFDTTYLVNRYKMHFASMVGVNHHENSILLG